MVDRIIDNVSVRTIAFGSCHKNSHANRRKSLVSPHSSSFHNDDTIWKAISSINPDVFLWLGDSVYSPNSKGVAPIESLKEEYQTMLRDPDIGYHDFVLHMQSSNANCTRPIHGTWDDHDYGGNDYGKQMMDKGHRKKLFLDFLEASSPTSPIQKQQDMKEHDDRQGVYSAITYRNTPLPDIPQTDVKIIALDTRWGRDLHHIPSLGANAYFPKLGSIFASFTRWLTAAMYIVPLYTESIHNVDNTNDTHHHHHHHHHRRMLQDEQWTWLEQQLSLPTTSDNMIHLPKVIIILSSIQVLTTNPLFESWGHFPEEKLRLLRLVNQYSIRRREIQRNYNHDDDDDDDDDDKNSVAILFLSGDVHHGEILDSSQVLLGTTSNPKTRAGKLVEITSSGLTHSISGAFHGTILAPALHMFSSHRYTDCPSNKCFYLHRNFGSIDIDRSNHTNRIQVNIHNPLGDVVLTTDWHPLSYYSCNMTDRELYEIAYSCLNGHVVKRIIQGYYSIFRYSYIVLLLLLSFSWTLRILRRRAYYKLKTS